MYNICYYPFVHYIKLQPMIKLSLDLGYRDLGYRDFCSTLILFVSVKFFTFTLFSSLLSWLKMRKNTKVDSSGFPKFI